MTPHREPGVHVHGKTRVEHRTIESEYLEREVKVDFYLPPIVSRDNQHKTLDPHLLSDHSGTAGDRPMVLDHPAAGGERPMLLDHPGAISLLLINDGQDLPKMPFRKILDGLWGEESIRPLLCVGIHCGKDRKMEYGTAGIPDYMGRGARAEAYTKFVFRELLPFIREATGAHHFHDKSFAGFSLGGLSALDIVWNHPHEFRHVGVFSGSLWWRTRDLDDDYVEDRDRIMHQQIRQGQYAPWLRFFFQTGVLDETADRNNNGIIDSIDDTLSLMEELEAKGYQSGRDMTYVEYEDGRHDVPTWGRAMPLFLKWAFGR
jgi:enterochelin esterase-like enzyme